MMSSMHFMEHIKYHTPIIAVQKIEQLPLKTLAMKLVGLAMLCTYIKV